jgi:hypothetical protein
MLTRSAANAAVGRASAMRRMRRRTANANSNRLYCSTNGCTSFLVLDDTGSTATCHICGYTRRLRLH